MASSSHRTVIVCASRTDQEIDRVLFYLKDMEMCGIKEVRNEKMEDYLSSRIALWGAFLSLVVYLSQ